MCPQKNGPKLLVIINLTFVLQEIFLEDQKCP